MTRPALALFAAALACAPVAAQTKEIDAQVKQDLSAIRSVERTEDVEVLRRILNKVLGLPNQMIATEREVPNTGRGVTLSDGSFHSGIDRLVTVSSPVGPFDGVYLAGHGVVFTLKVPASAGVVLDSPSKSFGLLDTCLKCHTAVPKDAVEPAPSAAVPASEWDRTRAELSGQKLPDGQKPGSTVVLTATVCEPGKMTEAILSKLRDNARHVRHMAPTDRVTVVVTFDGYSGSARNRYSLWATGWTFDNPFAAIGSPPIDPAAAMMMAAVPARPGFTAEETQLLNLADLHLRQGKPKDAAAAYEKALYRFKEPVVKVGPPANLTAAQKTELLSEFQKGVRDAYRRLAQAYLTDNEAEKAQAALDLSRKFKVEFTVGAAPASGVPVPAKLVLGVAKADLDKAASDPAAFKKAVTVETVGFPAANRTKPKQ